MVTGNVNYDAGNRSNWDTTLDLAKSPIIPYLGQNNFNIWKCPSDKATVTVKGQKIPCVRSNSISQVFDFGSWLPAGR